MPNTFDTKIGRVKMNLKGAWSNTATYTELDMVTYNNTSYIALKTVPAGTALTNTAYWQMVASGKTAYQYAVEGGYTGTEADYTEEQGDIGNALDDIAALETAMETKAEIDGSYEELTAGNAEQLVSTIEIEDKVPYNFRTSGGSVDIGDRETDMVVGGSIAWNQMIYSVNTASEVYGIKRDAAGTGQLRFYGTSGNTTNYTVGNFKSGTTGNPSHKYYATLGDVTLPTGAHLNLNNVDKKTYYIGTLATTVTGIGITVVSGTQIDVTVTPQVFDLTQMFGSTIADYIYTLESSTAGSGVAWFRALFPKPYYAYDAGTLMHVQTSAHEMVGFNQFDKSTAVPGTFDVSGNVVTGVNKVSDYIRVAPNTVYYITHGVNAANGRMAFTYDANKNMIALHYPEPYAETKTFGQITTEGNAAYIRICIPPNDVDVACFNISWDGERDGEYEPYVKHSYPLDSDLTLRGVPKLDADNRLYYDGDTYESDGTVTRRYGIVDLGSLTWVLNASNEFTASLEGVKGNTYGAVANALCVKYMVDTYNHVHGHTTDKTIAVLSTNSYLYVYDTGYSDTNAFKTAMSGVHLVYELAEPTTEEADAYHNPQIVDDFGTEEYVDTRTVPIPVGHDTRYQPNLRAKLEMAPNSPDSNGDYLVRHSNGTNSYVPITFPADELPAAPTTNGNYVLKCTVSGGTPTFTWASA